MEKKHILNSPKLQEFQNARREKQKKKLMIFLLVLIFVLVGIVVLSRYQKFRISNIEVAGNNVIEKSKITENVQNTISGYYFFFLPKNNFILLPEKEIGENLQKSFPRLTNIKITLLKENTMSIFLDERAGSYIWCGDSLKEEIPLENTKCYFMDDSGFIFDEAPFFSGNVYLRFMGNLPSSTEVVGQNFKKEIWADLLFFAKSLKEINLEPTVFLVKEDYIEVYLKHQLEPPNSAKIIFKTQDDIQKLIVNLKSVILSEPLKTKILENYKQLEYINLSFGNKIYYKFKNNSEDEEITKESLDDTQTQ